MFVRVNGKRDLQKLIKEAKVKFPQLEVVTDSSMAYRVLDPKADNCMVISGMKMRGGWSVVCNENYFLGSSLLVFPGGMS